MSVTLESPGLNPNPIVSLLEHPVAKIVLKKTITAIFADFFKRDIGKG
jgi:hypothetical protein